jgi:hypothetical protein
MFDDLQLDAVTGCGLFSSVASVTLIDISKLHMVSGNLLHLGNDPFHLRSMLLFGGGHMQRQQMSQRSVAASTVPLLPPYVLF